MRVAHLLVVVALSGCTCQRQENVEAKERLMKPQPKEDVPAAAAEKIDAGALTDAAKMKRVVHMDGTETWARLKSFRWSSDGSLSFGRGDAGVRSSEKTTMAQAESGEFSIETVTGDGTEMKLAYVNEVFFLKNNNGKWRVSRDPAGERNTYRTDTLAVWKSFYDLVSHALVVEPAGADTFNGRNVVAYSLKIPDQGAAAREEGRAVTDLPPAPVEVPDAGMQVIEDEDTRRTRIAGRVSKWAKRAKPGGGSGKLWVDEATGVIVKVDFEGRLVVGDGPEPAELKVKLHQEIKDIGKPVEVSAPKDAIAEITRKKAVVEPRTILEDAKVVTPLPRDAGPGGAPKKKKQQELPDDDEG